MWVLILFNFYYSFSQGNKRTLGRRLGCLASFLMNSLAFESESTVTDTEGESIRKSKVAQASALILRTNPLACPATLRLALE